MNVERKFRNELGNEITITVRREVPDTDLVCGACRWRAGHDPSCAHADTSWPTFLLSNDRSLVRIAGPSSISENYLTPRELTELCIATALATTEPHIAEDPDDDQ